MPVTVSGQVGEVVLSPGANQALRQGRLADQIVSELNGRYYEQAYSKRLFMAQAIVTAPVAYTTAAGIGGPLLFNGSSAVNAVILAVTFGITVVSTVAAALGLTGNTGQASAPTSTTAIDGSRNLFLGGPQSNCSVFRSGTVVNAGNFLLPVGALHTGALTTGSGHVSFVDVGGMLIVPPGGWCAVAASVAATAAVVQIGLIWAENPI